MKLCKDCIYCKQTPGGMYEGEMWKCVSPQNAVEHPVTGRKPIRVYCDFLRDNKEFCGPDGKWFKGDVRHATKAQLEYRSKFLGGKTEELPGQNNPSGD